MHRLQRYGTSHYGGTHEPKERTFVGGITSHSHCSGCKAAGLWLCWSSNPFRQHALCVALLTRLPVEGALRDGICRRLGGLLRGLDWRLRQRRACGEGSKTITLTRRGVVGLHMLAHTHAPAHSFALSTDSSLAGRIVVMAGRPHLPEDSRGKRQDLSCVDQEG